MPLVPRGEAGKLRTLSYKGPPLGGASPSWTPPPAWRWWGSFGQASVPTPATRRRSSRPQASITCDKVSFAGTWLQLQPGPTGRTWPGRSGGFGAV